MRQQHIGFILGKHIGPHRFRRRFSQPFDGGFWIMKTQYKNGFGIGQYIGGFKYIPFSHRNHRVKSHHTGVFVGGEDDGFLFADFPQLFCDLVDGECRSKTNQIRPRFFCRPGKPFFEIASRVGVGHIQHMTVFQRGGGKNQSGIQNCIVFCGFVAQFLQSIML